MPRRQRLPPHPASTVRGASAGVGLEKWCFVPPLKTWISSMDVINNTSLIGESFNGKSWNGWKSTFLKHLSMDVFHQPWLLIPPTEDVIWITQYMSCQDNLWSFTNTNHSTAVVANHPRTPISYPKSEFMALPLFYKKEMLINHHQSIIHPHSPSLIHHQITLSIP